MDEERAGFATLATRVPHAIRDEIVAAATKSRRTPSQIVRFLLEDMLATGEMARVLARYTPVTEGEEEIS